MIKVNIDMPESCSDCPMCHSKGKADPWAFCCFATMKDVDATTWDCGRMETCPIVQEDE